MYMQMNASRREKTLKRAEIIGIARCSEILKYQLPPGYNNQLYIELETHSLICWDYMKIILIFYFATLTLSPGSSSGTSLAPVSPTVRLPCLLFLFSILPGVPLLWYSMLPPSSLCPCILNGRHQTKFNFCIPH